MSKVQYIRSAVFECDYPESDLSEVAICGRSNAGKSSFINALAISRVAKVSGQPGKTRLLSFFNVAKKYMLVDMPGYGFAKRDPKEVASWKKMIENYMENRAQLRALMLIMDIRRDWSQEEEQLKNWAHHYGHLFLVILNKSDKLSRNQQAKRLSQIKKESGVDQLFLTSSSKRDGVKDVEKHLSAMLLEVEHHEADLESTED